MRLRRELQRLKNHFELFGLAPAYALDLGQLDRTYRDIQSRVHPDRHARAGEADRRASMQASAQVNEAYRVLKSPVQRARYLLELRGVDTGFDTDNAMPPDFLIQQMEWREALEDARDAAALRRLEQRLAEEKRMIEAHIASSIDAARDYAGAAGPVRKLMFLERFGEGIAEAYERLGV